MSVPMNVTKKSMSAESASMRNATSIESAFEPNQVAFSPIGSHVQSVATTPDCPCVSPHHARIARRAVTNDSAQATGPITVCAPANGISWCSPSPCPALFESPWTPSSPCPCGPFGASFPPSFECETRYRNPFTRNPSSGKTRIQGRSEAELTLSLQLGGVVEVHGALEAVHGDDDREADRGFAGGERDDEHREELPVEVAEVARERDEIQVRGVEDELDRHQHRQEVPANEDARDADGEEHERECDVMRDADHQSTRSIVRFPSTTAPIIATSRNTDATSNGSR